MNKNTHIIGGIVLAAILEKYVVDTYMDIGTLKTISNISMYYSFSVLGSILPDVDKPNTYIGNRLPYVARKINKKFGHRTITHSITLVLILYTLMLYLDINAYITYGITIGMLSHIILDLFNGRGVALLYPVDTKFNIANIKTNSSDETVFKGILALLLFVLFIYK